MTKKPDTMFRDGIKANLKALIQRRVAPETLRSTARQGRHRHFHSATHTTATTSHHPRI